MIKLYYMNSERVLEKFEIHKKGRLITSVVLDALGMFTYALPLLGELGDIIYAPFYGLAILIMYRKRIVSAVAGGFVGFMEEILPGTDFFPTATVMWFYTFVLKRERTLKAFISDTRKEMDFVNREI